MKGNPEVLNYLQQVLQSELTAISQYFLHAEMLDNWGYKGLGKYTKGEAIGEMKHAEAVLERMLFLDGQPNMQELFKLRIGQDVKQIHENDLALEYEAVERLNRAIAAAVAAADNGSRELFERILKEEEEHVDFLEAQLTMIEQMGLPNYLVTQIEKENA
ncbi:MAG: bacterioferritin [Bryobacter sp.]|jgi:bacterioferritin|nr:bacterioferritin [Bryobacter sp. CoA8 C33]